ncbi:Cro/C1-type helix-turn-helix DNA-binding protein [Kineothrix alysoides]|uniref:Cro/C1-type helix-turn-helix DNA-binding protein n=2 Tax=Kineothrix alysoides TaxID=1469948 RepID=A0A4R1QVK5_9FIRM|nr:helix-turn-helix transcriptional regulator [Kineothrix alysoides]TCL57617.1 Cro/C1-type helix-turn-helix DNA-binding protein [Kineothrix alysoides]
MDIQGRIKQLMQERKWTDYKLAKQANLSESTITNIFKRNNSPSFNTLEAICKACGITLAQFFTEGDSPITLTEDQRTLLAKWSVLTEKQKNILIDLMNNI